MICVRLNGGLGNQLFQYAAGRALSLRLGVGLALDLSTLSRRSSRFTPREFELDLFNHAGHVLPSRDMRLLPWMHRIAPLSRWISPWRTIVEKGVQYQTEFEALKDQSYLIGYWQSFRYFANIAPQLLKDLEPVKSLSAENLKILALISDTESVAIHVRRGDYVTLQSAANTHGVLSTAYYDEAIAIMEKRFSNPKFFIFSDDMAWCRSNLRIETEKVYIDKNSGSSAWQDLLLMAGCKHNIIANSSFSWWGAWLNANPDKVVVAPKNWFASDKNTSDLLPPSWAVL